MIDYLASFINTNGAAFPGTLAINATGAGTGDGTEFVKLFVDDLWGARQALLDAAGLTPDSVTEAIDTSQELEAIRMISGAPGNGVIWWADSDPAVLGERVLLLTGQVIAIASYPELAAAVYCGNANNATASAFYKTSDAGGTIRDTAGAYMVLPDLRGYFLRGLDVAAAVDPDGASRDIGHQQDSAMWGHFHQSYDTSAGGALVALTPAASRTAITGVTNLNNPREAISDGINPAPNLSSESRPVNIACEFGIRY
jgi:hypothetical protein